MLSRLTAANRPDRTRLGDLLVARGRLAPAELDRALADARPGERLGEALVRLGLVRQGTIRRVLLEQRLRRAVAAVLTAVVAGAAPGLAAANGGLGTTSSASARISVTIPARVEVRGVRDALRHDATWDDGRGWRHVQPFCVLGTAVPRYSVAVEAGPGVEVLVGDRRAPGLLVPEAGSDCSDPRATLSISSGPGAAPAGQVTLTVRAE